MMLNRRRRLRKLVIKQEDLDQMHTDELVDDLLNNDVVFEMEEHPDDTKIDPTSLEWIRRRSKSRAQIDEKIVVQIDHGKTKQARLKYSISGLTKEQFEKAVESIKL